MKKKFLALLLALTIVFNTGVAGTQTANAQWQWPNFELPKIELPKFELPKFELPSFTIPGINFTIDPGKGLDQFKEILDVVPDKVGIPGTGLSIYPKESIANNIIKNLPGLASEFVNSLNPFKAASSIAHILLKLARPYIEPAIKKFLPAPFKGGAYQFLEQIKGIMKAIDIPIVKDVVLTLWDFLVGPIDDLAIEIVEILAEEQKQPPPEIPEKGEDMIMAIGTEGEIIFPTPWVNKKPIGAFDNLDENGMATGWALDPDNPSASIKVRMHPILGQFQNEVIANLPSLDIGHPGAHGFSYRIPSGMRDGKENILEAYGKDVTEFGVEALLNGSPKKYTLFEKAFGEIAGISEKGQITGWAVDPDMVDDGAEVKFYLDSVKDGGGKVLGSTKTNGAYAYIDPQKLFKAPKNIKNISFSFNVDPEQYYDGVRHKIHAYVVNRDDQGKTWEYELANSPVYFMYPKTLPISFKDDPITVQQGSRVFQTIFGVGNKDHLTNAYLDDKSLDINEEKHGYPFYNYDKGIAVKNDGTGVDTRSVDFSFKTAKDLSLGEHKVTVESSYTDYLGFVYKGSFKINVVPYNSLQVLVPEDVSPENEYDVFISNIPKQIKFSGKEANASITGLQLIGNITNFYAPAISFKENGDGTAVMTVKVPHEASYIRKDSGPVIATITVNYNTELAREEFRATEYMHFGNFDGKTKESKNPIFTPSCKSSLQAVLNLKDGTGSSYGSGNNFGCYKKITSVSVTGEKAGKHFSFSLPYGGWGSDILKSESPLVFFGQETNWKGDIESFGIDTSAIWNRDYVDVGPITVTVKDEEGNTASASITIDTPYRVKVVPLEGDKILLGEYIRVLFKGFGTDSSAATRLSIKIDGEEMRTFELNKYFGKFSEKLQMAYYDELYIPNWMTPGEHKLAIEDISNVGAKGKILYRAETTFVIDGPIPQEEEKQEPENVEIKKVTEPEKVPEKKPEPVKLNPSISVSPLFAKAGEYVNVSVKNFGPLGTVSITIGGIKVSGYADYTDSSGALSKSVKVPESLAAGSYKIVATDTQGLLASASFTVLAPPPPPEEKPVIKPPAPKPKPKPKPVPEPVVEPQPEPVVAPDPEPSKTDLPKDDSTKTSCPSGFIYSVTFKTCIEDDAQDSVSSIPDCPSGTTYSPTLKICVE